MRAADVFCLPSIREGCPNVILEALASGRPVVASRVGGIPELAGPENSILVPPSDPEALADALGRALAREWDPEALRGSVAHHTWEDSAGALYQAACEAVALRVADRSHSAPVQRSPSGS
jgi:glycosyltransferase involved in cell wall biosynthesis